MLWQLPETARLFFGESLSTAQLIELAKDARVELRTAGGASPELERFAGKLPLAPVLDLPHALDNPFVHRIGMLQDLPHRVALRGERPRESLDVGVRRRSLIACRILQGERVSDHERERREHADRGEILRWEKGRPIDGCELEGHKEERGDGRCDDARDSWRCCGVGLEQRRAH